MNQFQLFVLNLLKIIDKIIRKLFKNYKNIYLLLYLFKIIRCNLNISVLKWKQINK